MFTTFALSQDIVGHTNHSPPTRVHIKRLKQIVSPSSSNKMFSGFRSLQHTKRERAEISVCKISKHERTIQDEEQQTEHTDFFFYLHLFISRLLPIPQLRINSFETKRNGQRPCSASTPTIQNKLPETITLCSCFLIPTPTEY